MGRGIGERENLNFTFKKINLPTYIWSISSRRGSCVLPRCITIMKLFNLYLKNFYFHLILEGNINRWSSKNPFPLKKTHTSQRISLWPNKDLKRVVNGNLKKSVLREIPDYWKENHRESILLEIHGHIRQDRRITANISLHPALSSTKCMYSLLWPTVNYLSLALPDT